MNVRDSEVVCGLLKNAGYTLVDDDEKADVVIFNTCSVRKHAEDRVWGSMEQLKKLKQKRQKETSGSSVRIYSRSK